MTRPLSSTIAASLAATICLGGCTQAPAPPREPARAAATKPDDHGHSHDEAEHDTHATGPHDGAIAEWGNCEYHLEFTVDHDRKEAVVYVLGDDEKTATPVKAAGGTLLLTIREPAFQVELTARPLAGESDGASSCYGGTHDNLGIVRDFAGTISGEVEGTPFAGEFTEQPHGAHDHE